MRVKFAIAGLIVAGLALAGCNGSLEDIAPKAERQLPQNIINQMQARGMSKSSPIMVRIFKEEDTLEVWKQRDNGRFDIIATYDICTWSGKLGPKFTEGDRQAPEGFYTVRPHQMNPRSSYHLSFNLGFPNAFDRANGRTGQHLMVHGACSSAGCYSMEDGPIEEIFAFAREAFRGGQTEFQVQAFPFRMTAANLARYRDDPNFEFWKMLKEGYDHFELTRVPPKVDVCDRRYVFNQYAENGRDFVATAACPPMNQPEALQTAFRSHQRNFQAAFEAAISESNGVKPPAPTIAGLTEARVVADWSRRRARGERVSREPPNMSRPAETAVAAAPAPAPRETPAVAAASASQASQVSTEVGAPVPAANPLRATAEAPQSEGVRSRMGRLLGMFSN